MAAMSGALLVLNAGSSSLKCSVFLDDDPPRLLLRGQLDGMLVRPRFVARSADRVVAEKEWDRPIGHQEAIEFLFRWGRDGVPSSGRITAVGHRVVHGGTTFTGPVRLDAAAIAELEALTPLAPLHQPGNVAAIKTIAAIAPALPPVACFDMPFIEPSRRSRNHLRCRAATHAKAAVLPTLDRRAAAGRTIVAHLGNGASLCAMDRGQSVATTMGFSTLDGLVMGTRCGAIDPGVLLYLINRRGMSPPDLERLLYEQSGLLGVSEMSSDMRELLASHDARAAEAVDLFVYRVGRELGSLAATLGGVDALVFTGGIGEHAAPIRARVCRGAAWLGLELDDRGNAAGGPCISMPGSTVAAWVIPTNEELMIALHTRRVLTNAGSAFSRLSPAAGTAGSRCR
jgi:acetate kinase